MPSFSKIRTAASIARILAISRLADVAGRDDHGNDRRSQWNRICFPRCGMIAEKGRGIRQLDRPHNETMGLPAFAIKRAKLPPTGCHTAWRGLSLRRGERHTLTRLPGGKATSATRRRLRWRRIVNRL